jgi:hypothetical protein
MSESMPVVNPENWESFNYRSEDALVVASFDVTADELDRDDFPYCARIIIPIADPNEFGAPESAEAEVLWRLEDELTEALELAGVRCRLVARLTHNGEREIVFQLADWEEFRGPVGDWMDTVDDYDFEVSEHEGWEFFEDFCWPTDEDWCLIQDRNVITGLLEAGSNPDKEHTLDFSFQGDPEQLHVLREQLLERGYQLSDEETDDDVLVMIRRLPLSMDLIGPESLENRRLCDEIGVEFTGWGAAVEA